MDLEEDCVASGTTSACKRPRKNTDSRIPDGQIEETTAQAGGEKKTVATSQSVINSTTITSNNNNEEEKGDMLGQELALMEQQKQEEIEQPKEKEQLEKVQLDKEKTEPKNEQSEKKLPEEAQLVEDQAHKDQEQLEDKSNEEQAGPSSLECQLPPHAASAELATNKPKTVNSILTMDSDDQNPSSAALLTSPRFNLRNIPPTRSYRRINIELTGTVTDSDSTDSVEVPEQQEEDEQDEQEDTEGADADVDTDGQVAPAGPSADESSSNDEMVHRYDLSSENDLTTEDEMEFNETEANAGDREKVDFAVDKEMGKQKPAYTFNSLQELMHREHNIINRIGWRGGHTSAQSFGLGYYGSRQVVEQMTLLSCMNGHSGCVNCLNFNRAGDLICSGSDDLNIVVWDWANEKPLHSFHSGHSMNIFQTKFIDSAGCLDIVAASRDGQVRRAVVPPSGGATKPMRLYTHSESVHKIVLVPHSRHELMSAGEDAAVKHFDLRTSNAATTLLRCVYHDANERSRVRLFSIAHHPFAPEFCVSGSDDTLRVYDKRKLTKPLHEMTPTAVEQHKIAQITCAVYNHSGSEILASFSDAGIYLFDSRNYKDGEFLHCYEGHINSRTIKGVNFFGPKSEYIVSGSDCGNIFFWDKNTEAIVNFMKGDHAGVVNCLEPHPWMPVLATSGLEHDVKIWTPNGPDKSGPHSDSLKQTLQRNFSRNIVDRGDFDINQFQYFIRGFLEGSRSRLAGNPGSAAEWRRRARSNRSDSSSSSSSDDTNGPGVHCRTQ
ncbi:DDB1- and CUL4-associated factor 8 [Drosophila elegans]|uniref:DDB1- and CUL4-associated factor 8 n=1 Tax=Drosophila elegans TaxID=30023 RepID=UPI001BC85682|nr:DDB1- and CUL4-associated factor 8 [Drosophila elegans]